MDQMTRRPGRAVEHRALPTPSKRRPRTTGGMIRWMASHAEQSGLLTEREASLLTTLSRFAKPCVTGGFVTVLDVTALATLQRKSRSTFYRQVRSLELKGWLVDRSCGNGARRVLNGIRLGLDLSPTLDRLDDVEAATARLWHQVEAEGSGRALLKRAKGELRRYVARARRLGEDLSAEAARLLDAIPRRFEALSLHELHAMTSEIECFLNDLKECGRPKMGHGDRVDDAPTDTEKASYVCREEAGENERGEVAPRRPNQAPKQSEEFALTPAELVALIPPRLRDEIAETYGQGRDALWLCMWEAARARWAEVGETEDGLAAMSDRLGRPQASVLALYVAAQARRGHVRNPLRYLQGCARKSLAGDFMWRSGAQAAKRLIAREAATVLAP